MTMDILKVILALGAGYLLGSLNAAILVGKVLGKDVRKYGSKSAGLTNTLRVLGRPAAAIVFLGDVLKGILACLIGIYLDNSFATGNAVSNVALLSAGAGAIIGHNWPVYFSFKGGKGVLTAIAVLFMINWVMASICLVLFVTVVALSRYVSLGTICATLVFVLLSFLPVFSDTILFNAFAILMAIIIVMKHRTNIDRLVVGQENKLRF